MFNPLSPQRLLCANQKVRISRNIQLKSWGEQEEPIYLAVAVKQWGGQSQMSQHKTAQIHCSKKHFKTQHRKTSQQSHKHSIDRRTQQYLNLMFVIVYPVKSTVETLGSDKKDLILSDIQCHWTLKESLDKNSLKGGPRKPYLHFASRALLVNPIVSWDICKHYFWSHISQHMKDCIHFTYFEGGSAGDYTSLLASIVCSQSLHCFFGPFFWIWILGHYWNYFPDNKPSQFSRITQGHQNVNP